MPLNLTHTHTHTSSKLELTELICIDKFKFSQIIKNTAGELNSVTELCTFTPLVDLSVVNVNYSTYYINYSYVYKWLTRYIQLCKETTMFTTKLAPVKFFLFSIIILNSCDLKGRKNTSWGLPNNLLGYL